MDNTIQLDTDNVIYFDDQCILCNKCVQFILKWEKNKILKFASIQTLEKPVVGYREMDLENTIVFKEGNKIYVRSEAIFKILNYLDGFWPLFKVFKIIPIIISDKIYKYIAKRRLSWFGENKFCLVPNQIIKERVKI